MRRLAAFSLFATLLAPQGIAHAQFCTASTPEGWHQTASGTPGCVALNAGLGGSTGYGTNVVAQNDDGFQANIDLTPAFPMGLNFYGGPYTRMWVNTNGNITFHAGLGTFTPARFPRRVPATDMARAPMIAPYWADVDTRDPSDGPSVTSGHDRVYYDIRNGQVTVTWFDVGYYSNHYTSRMSFQLILTNATGTCGSGDFDVEFRYNRCEWVAGTASGSAADGTCANTTTCTPANVGFDANDGALSGAGTDSSWVSIPEALTNNVVNVCTGSNVSMPGIYRWQVRGGALVCPGSGAPCETGMQGACGIGVEVCHATGVVCDPVGTASTETCDNIDNDCNGSVDDGDGLCPGTEVCTLGTCIASCFEGACEDGFMCGSDGRCVENDCVGVSCPANQRCIHGSCMDSCTGVVCPHGQQCAAGRCQDLCTILTCDTGYVCQDGMCVGTCPCNPCPSGSSCNADGTCSIDACSLTTCPDGQYCQTDGTCADSCAAAICPANQHCAVGQCVLDGSDAGPTDVDSGIDITPHDTGTSSSHIDAGPDGGARGPRRVTGCGCSTTSSTEGVGASVGLLALALVIARRRKARASR